MLRSSIIGFTKAPAVCPQVTFTDAQGRPSHRLPYIHTVGLQTIGLQTAHTHPPRDDGPTVCGRGGAETPPPSFSGPRHPAIFRARIKGHLVMYPVGRPKPGKALGLRVYHYDRFHCSEGGLDKCRRVRAP